MKRSKLGMATAAQMRNCRYGSPRKKSWRRRRNLGGRCAGSKTAPPRTHVNALDSSLLDSVGQARIRVEKAERELEKAGKMEAAMIAKHEALLGEFNSLGERPTAPEDEIVATFSGTDEL
eukprot:SAG31_NODE_2139_length_6349_cov_2.773636_9_plen_120_part_00